MKQTLCPVAGAGLGLRRSFINDVLGQTTNQPDFVEVAPENWMTIGGAYGRKFAEVTERYPLLCHGLSLSIGSPAPLDELFLKRLKTFFDKHQVVCYSEHLSYCSDDGQLYDLMPIPFTEEAVQYVAERIRRVQDTLERQLVIENVSYYAAPGQQLDEITFLKAILQDSGCGLLLDVNNVYVNSINHDYDPVQYIQAMPTEQIAYLHIAGHYNEAEDLIIDTHGADIIDPVWRLLEQTYHHHGVLPTLLERDFNIPAYPELLTELDTIRLHQQHYRQRTNAHG